jgi:hypothetical protein
MSMEKNKDWHAPLTGATKPDRDLLRRGVPPMAHAELERDLWPRMLRRLDEGSRRVPWFDWALVAVVVIWAISAPQMIPILLFHL